MYLAWITPKFSCKRKVVNRKKISTYIRHTNSKIYINGSIILNSDNITRSSSHTYEFLIHEVGLSKLKEPVHNASVNLNLFDNLCMVYFKFAYSNVFASSFLTESSTPEYIKGCPSKASIKRNWCTVTDAPIRRWCLKSLLHRYVTWIKERSILGILRQY